MSVLAKAIGWIADHRRPFYYLGFAAVALLLLVIVYRGHKTENSLIADWNDTIRVLGIEPIFPPEEDMYVGDLLAVVISDTHKDQSATDKRPLLNRAIKLWHIDVSKELHAYYDNLPMFPDTADKPADKGKFWPQNSAADWTFQAPPIRKVLPIAAFPGFVVESQSNASGALGAAFGSISAVLQTNDDTQLQIPFVESYGIPSLVATKILDRFCDDPETSSACTDSTIRQHLGFVSNKPESYMTDTETDANGDVHFMVQIELALVNRVYLTRSIEQKVGHGSKRSTKAKAKNEKTVEPNGSSPGREQAAAASPPAQGSSAGANPLEGETSADQNWDDTSNLDEVFERPIAFGYRAVKRRFDATPRPKLLPGQLFESSAAQPAGPATP